MNEALRVKTAAEGEFAVCLAESLKREMFRDDGATSPESWTAECFGVSVATARSYAHVAEKSDELPDLMGSLCAGEISFDKVRTVVDVATPETDQELAPRPRSSMSASWPRWPGPPPPGPGPLRSPRHVQSTTAATCASTMSTAPCRSSCPKSPTPRPRPVSMPLRPVSPPTPARHRSTSGAATGSWDHRLGTPGHGAADHLSRHHVSHHRRRPQPVLRGGPCAPGGPGR